MTTPTPTEVAQRQLDAYNARDLEAFVAVFAEDAEIFELGAREPSTVGQAAIRARYRELFDRSPALACTILNRTAFGRVVIDFERITGRMGAAAPVEFLAIYEIEDGLIRRVHFVR